MFCGLQAYECYVYKVNDVLELLTMLFLDDQESIIRNAQLVDDQTILLSTESGKIYKFSFKETQEQL